MALTRQIPLLFEFRANQTFDDFFPGPNLEVIHHLQKCIAGNGERLIFLWGQSGLGQKSFVASLLPAGAKPTT